jgi:hypothetical protein
VVAVGLRGYKINRLDFRARKTVFLDSARQRDFLGLAEPKLALGGLRGCGETDESGDRCLF